MTGERGPGRASWASLAALEGPSLRLAVPPPRWMQQVPKHASPTYALHW